MLQTGDLNLNWTDMETKPSNASKTELKQFGLTFGVITALLFGLIVPFIWRGRDVFASPSALPLWPWVLGGLFILVALTYPLILGPFNRLWLKFGHLAGRVNTYIILLVAYSLLITTTGLIMRLFRHDFLGRRLDKEAESYRIIRKPRNAEHMRKPY